MRADREILEVLDIWSQTPNLTEEHLGMIHRLIESLMIGRERYDQYVSYFIDNHFQTLQEAIALARFYKVLEEWPNAETT